MDLIAALCRLGCMPLRLWPMKFIGPFVLPAADPKALFPRGLLGVFWASKNLARCAWPVFSFVTKKLGSNHHPNTTRPFGKRLEGEV